MFQATNALLAAALADMLALVGSPANGILTGVKIGLFTNNPPLSENLVLGDLTEPTYTGYARQAVTWISTPIRQEDGSYMLAGNPLPFHMGDAATPTTVTGAFICGGSSPFTLLGVTQFTEPQPLVSVDDAALIEVELALAAAGFTKGPDVD